MPRLKVDIEKSFAGGRESAPFSLAVKFEAGDGVTVVFGPSGSGKTLTLESIAGFSRPDLGSIYWGDEALFDSTSQVDLPARLRRCGYVFQKDALFPHMSVRENLAFAAHGDAASVVAVDELLRRFHIESLSGRRPYEISGGERQRATIARALTRQPRFLLLDEPARGLDISLRRELYEILRQVRRGFELPMMLVTHDLEEAFELGDNMLVYHAGRLTQQGPPREVYERPVSAEVARLLGLTNVFEGRVREIDAGAGRKRIEAQGLLLFAPMREGDEVGAPVSFCVRPEAIRAWPRNGRVSEEQVEVTLDAAVQMAGQVRLQFSGAVSALLPISEFQRHGPAREWVIEVPAAAVWEFPPQGSPPDR